MCEFCLQHGEGKKWYLQAKNYADDLLSDLKRRRFIETFLADPEALAKEVHDIERLNKLPPFIRKHRQPAHHPENEKSPFRADRPH